MTENKGRKSDRTKGQLKAVLAKAEEQGISPEEIAEKLGISL